MRIRSWRVDEALRTREKARAAHRALARRESEHRSALAQLNTEERRMFDEAVAREKAEGRA